MAITVNNTIDPYLPVFNPIVFTVSSTNYAQSNFFYIADIYINSAVTMTSRLKFVPYPGQNYGYIDVSGVLKNYLTSNPYALTDTGFEKNGNSILKYDIKWGEEYGPSSGVTTYTNLATSTGYAFNGSLPHVNFGNQTTISDWTNWISLNYYNPGTITFLTNAPRTINIRTGESYALYFLNDASGNAYEAFVAYKNAAGGAVGSQTISNTYNTVSTYDTRYQRICCGPANLTVPANTAYYQVYLRAADTSTNSEIFRFNIDNSCSKASINYRLYFKNKYGGFDAFTFMGQYSRTVEIKKENFMSDGGKFVGNIYSYLETGRATRQFNTISSETFKCTSGWITEAESDWLLDLVESPEVYIVSQQVAELVPIIVTDVNYTYKTVSKDQLFNLEVTFKPTYDNVRQQW